MEPKSSYIEYKSDFWCSNYHIVAHTNIMSRMKVFRYIAQTYGYIFVSRGAFHLIEGTCNDMYNPTIDNVCVNKYADEVTLYEDYACGLNEKVMNSSYTDFVQCMAGNYRDLMVKFVEAKMERFKFNAPVVLNRITFHWPVVGKDSECEILEKMFV